MSAAMLSLGERISLELKRGDLNQIYIRGDLGYVIITSVGGEAILTVMAKADAKLGLVFFDIKKTARSLASLI
jgi:predicted regulator of Ras-like GTPase activity (Roadblock/LC7/MglB family)